jgi:ribonuclease HIII
VSGYSGYSPSSSPGRNHFDPADIILSSGAGRIGTDESGKGDYFGPLVVAAVWADAATGARMAEWGITDSKKLTDKRAATLAAKIVDAGIPHTVVAIGPEKYNQLYAKMRNLNHLLAWAHARAMENLLGSVEAEVIVADQFGDASLIERALMEKGRTVKLFQMPRGERDIAVAAASVVARAEFLSRLKKLSLEIGITLPKGAGPPVDAAGAEVIRRLGVEKLTIVAKRHFKNTLKAQKLL